MTGVSPSCDFCEGRSVKKFKNYSLIKTVNIKKTTLHLDLGVFQALFRESRSTVLIVWLV